MKRYPARPTRGIVTLATVLLALTIGPASHAATGVAPIGKVSLDADNTLSADRPLLACPVTQKPARNGSAPDPELLKLVLRCGIGEKAASKGYDGAVTVEIDSLRVGTPRPWDRLLDKNGGTPGTTVVYPVKLNYSVRTFYRSHTKVEEGWNIIYNMFVNGFGEWQYGSFETVKGPDIKSVPR